MSRKYAIDKIIHVGHREILPENHVFRYCGVSKCCCPKGYYNGADDSVAAVNKLFDDFKLSARPKTFMTPVLTERWTTGIPKSKGVKAVPSVQRACDGNRSKAAPDTTLFNKGYQWKHFKEFVYPAHCDFRAVKKYSRHSDEHYDINGEGYEREYDELRDKLTSSGTVTALERLKVKKKIQKLLKDKHNGIKGLSPYYALIYKKNRAGIRDSVCFDPFHCLMNISEKIINMIKGVKLKVDKHAVLALCENRFPFMGLKRNRPTDDVNSGEPVVKKKKNQKKKTKRNQYSDIANSNLIPFTLAKRQQELVDWRQNCIVLPFGQKTSNSFRFIFRQTGYLKGNDKIKWLTVFLKFTLIFSDLQDEYKNFLSLMSDLISDILSPVVSDEYIADLFMRTVEALCLWEMMLLDSEQDFAVHELLDIVDSLAQFGPARGWWALAGERFMAKVKNCTPKGGANCLKVLYHRFVSYENNAKFNEKENDLYLDSLGRYSDNMIKFTGSKHRIESWYWSDWLKSNFYSYLYQYVDTLEVDEVYLKSPFMRLYETYKSIKHFKSASWSFWDWIRFLISTDFNDTRFFIAINPTENISHVSDLEMKRCQRAGIIITSDIEIAIELYNYVPIVYNNATIKGVQFRGRGVEFVEYKDAVTVRKYGGDTSLIIPSNKNNNLLNNWEDSTQYSSFAKYNNWKINITTKKNAPSIQYCQVNCFLRFSLPGDPYLHNVGFANITGRLHDHKIVGACSVPYITVKITDPKDIPKPALPKPPVESSEILETNIQENKLRSQSKPTEVVQAVSQAEIPAYVIVKNFRPDVQFICASFIESTSIAVCGMTTTEDPILLPGNKNGLSQEELDDGVRFCCENPRDIDKLYLIEIHTTRKHVNINKFDAAISEKCV